MAHDAMTELMPEHREDLRASGLSDSSIRAAGIFSVTGDRAREILGFGSRRIKSAMVFPYPDGKFVRLKVFPLHRDRRGKKVKYLQPRSSENHLYIPPSVRKRVGDTKAPLYFIEGEKKSLRGAQDGFCCVGLSGVWGWSQKGGVIPDVKRLPLAGRRVYLVPDSDIHQNPDIQAAMNRLWQNLERLGARVSLVLLPQGRDNQKIGLDDFLEKESAKAFGELPRIRQRTELPNFPAIYKQGGGELELVSMGRIPEPPEQEKFMGGLIARDHITTLYGDGGQGKSLLAMAFAVAFAKGKRLLGFCPPKGSVVYLDWELSLEEQQRRAFQVARGFGLKSPPERLLYGNPALFITQLLPALRRKLERKNVRLLVIDSAGLACGISPEAADAVMDVYQKIKALGVTCLVIDHQSKLQDGQKAFQKTVFGSAYKFNLSRSVLHLQRVGFGKNPLKLRLRHKKNNFGALHDDIGLKVKFSESPRSVRVRRFDLSTDPDAASMLGAAPKILEALRTKPLEVSELVKTTGLPERTVANTLNDLRRLKDVRKVDKNGRRDVWGIAQEAGEGA